MCASEQQVALFKLHESLNNHRKKIAAPQPHLALVIFHHMHGCIVCSSSCCTNRQQNQKNISQWNHAYTLTYKHFPLIFLICSDRFVHLRFTNMQRIFAYERNHMYRTQAAHLTLFLRYHSENYNLRNQKCGNEAAYLLHSEPNLLFKTRKPVTARSKGITKGNEFSLSLSASVR